MTAQDAQVARLRVQNNGAEPLELVLEYHGSDHWLRPGETFVVWTVGSSEGDPWPGTKLGNEPFQVDNLPGSVTVHFNGVHGYVTDVAGNEIACRHGRPVESERV
ncbi:hypothetical protein ACFXD5_40540 [Streptomyces sp. NPDC059385]|uniref:hypothetical protein n=1 Tax=Streptomyces sp. NPDC059385 TaxID=3346817 RepID=UPI0036864AE2